MIYSESRDGRKRAGAGRDGGEHVRQHVGHPRRGAGGERPTTVSMVAVVVVFAGLVVLATGVALVLDRDNQILQLPLLLERFDQALPFDDGQDLDTYVAAIGAIVAASGLGLALLGLGIRRGRRAAYVTTVVLFGALTAGAALLRTKTTDDFALLAVTAIGGSVAVLFVLVLALLLARRSRAWVLGRRTVVA